MPYKPGPNSGSGGPSNTIYFRGFNYSNAYFYYTDLYGLTNRIGNNVTWANYSGVTWVNAGALTPDQAKDIDQKIDDGYPLTGAFLGFDGSTPTNSGTIIGSSCVVAGTNTYTTVSSMGCRTMYFLQ